MIVKVVQDISVLKTYSQEKRPTFSTRSAQSRRLQSAHSSFWEFGGLSSNLSGTSSTNTSDDASTSQSQDPQPETVCSDTVCRQFVVDQFVLRRPQLEQAMQTDIALWELIYRYRPWENSELTTISHAA